MNSIGNSSGRPIGDIPFRVFGNSLECSPVMPSRCSFGNSSNGYYTISCSFFFLGIVPCGCRLFSGTFLQYLTRNSLGKLSKTSSVISFIGSFGNPSRSLLELFQEIFRDLFHEVRPRIFLAIPLENSQKVPLGRQNFRNFIHKFPRIFFQKLLGNSSRI